MNRSKIHRIVLNAFLVAASIFFLLSPTIFAYVSEVSMSYARVPKWFAATAPARITARIFDRYNANPPRAARFRQHLTCFLADEGAKRNVGCTHGIRGGERVHGPQELEMTRGSYAARFAFLGNAVCGSGDVRL